MGQTDGRIAVSLNVPSYGGRILILRLSDRTSACNNSCLVDSRSRLDCKSSAVASKRHSSTGAIAELTDSQQSVPGTR